MNPEVFAVRGFDDGLVEICVGDDPIEPAVENLLVGMGFAIAPFGVLGDRDVEVGSFTKGVIADLLSFIKTSNFKRS